MNESPGTGFPPDIAGHHRSSLRKWADLTRQMIGLSAFVILPLWLFPALTDPTREGRFLVFEFIVSLLLLLEIFPSAHRYRWKWDLMQVPMVGLGALFMLHIAVDPYLPGAFGQEFEGGVLIHHRYAFRYGLRYGAFVAWALLITSGRFGPRFLTKALDLTMLVSVPIAIYAVLQYFGYEFLQWKAAQERMRVISTIGNPLFLADYLAVCMVLFLVNLPRRRGKVIMVLSCCALPLLGYALYATSSRGAVLAVGLGVVAFLAIFVFQATHGRGWRAILTFGVVLLVLVAVLGLAVTQMPSAVPWVGRLQDALSFTDFSLLSRLILWQVCLRQWSVAPWIGVGMEQFRLRHLPVLRHVLEDTPGAAAVIRTSKVVAANEAHGDYFQVLAEWGIVGLAFFILILVIALYRSGRVFLFPSGRWTRREQGAAGALFGVLVVFAAEMLYGFQLRLPPHILLLFSCAAFITSLWRFPAAIHRQTSRAQWEWRRAVRRLPLVVVAAGIGAFSLMVYRAEVHGTLARTLLRLGRIAQAQRHLRIANRLVPEHGDFVFLYGVTLWEQNRELDRALRLFDRAILTSTNTRIPIAKGLLLMKNLRNNQGAHRVLQDFAELHAPVEGLHHARGLVEFLNRDYPAATEELETEIRLYPDNYEATIYLGICYRLTDQTNLAIETFRRARNLKPRGLDAHIQLGEIYREQRAHVDSAREIQRALDIAREVGDMKTAGELRILLGQILRESGIE